MQFYRVSYITRNPNFSKQRLCSPLWLIHFPLFFSLLLRHSVVAGFNLSGTACISTDFVNPFCNNKRVWLCFLSEKTSCYLVYAFKLRYLIVFCSVVTAVSDERKDYWWCFSLCNCRLCYVQIRSEDGIE